MTTAAPSRPTRPLTVLDRQQTADVLGFPALVDAIAAAALQVEAGQIVSPERMVLPLGSGGVLLSMPAAAPDIGIHKLVNVQPGNAQRGLPTIHGAVTVCDAATGRIELVLDGPEVTGRRTAAVSLLAIRTLLTQAPRHVLLIGTGAQSAYHLQALRAVYPGCRISVQARSGERAAAFCAAHGTQDQPLLALETPAVPVDVDVVIALTTATSPVYDEPGRPGRLVIGVGAFRPDMAEIGARTLADSTILADDPAGARHEAGDLLQANVDWQRVGSLASVLQPPQQPRQTPGAQRAIVFKSVGTAAWDLAAARVALQAVRRGD